MSKITLIEKAKLGIKESMHKDWSVPKVVRSYLKVYQILYWHPEYFRNELVDGCIVKDGISYSVVYMDGKNPVYYRSEANQVALSFRAAKEEYNLHPIVLVKGVK